jgi:hypothetical protein
MPGKFLTTDGTRASWAAGGGGGAVSSVFGRTGAVVAQSGDYASVYAMLFGGNVFSGAQDLSGASLRLPEASITSRGTMRYNAASGLVEWYDHLSPVVRIAMPNPMTSLGDLVYGGTSGAVTRLAGHTNASLRVLGQTGDGTLSAAPAWTRVGYMGGGNSSLTVAAGSTMCLPAIGGSLTSGCGNVRDQPAAMAGYATNLYVRINGGTSGHSTACGLQINGALSALVTAAFTETVITQKSNTTNIVSIAAGDGLQMVCTNSGTAGSGLIAAWSFLVYQ